MAEIRRSGKDGIGLECGFESMFCMIRGGFLEVWGLSRFSGFLSRDAMGCFTGIPNCLLGIIPLIKRMVSREIK